MAENGFDISKYIKAEDIVAAVAAGVVAYIRNRPKVDDTGGCRSVRPASRAHTQRPHMGKPGLAR